LVRPHSSRIWKKETGTARKDGGRISGFQRDEKRRSITFALQGGARKANRNRCLSPLRTERGESAKRGERGRRLSPPFGICKRKGEVGGGNLEKRAWRVKKGLVESVKNKKSGSPRSNRLAGHVGRKCGKEASIPIDFLTVRRGTEQGTKDRQVGGAG